MVIFLVSYKKWNSTKGSIFMLPFVGQELLEHLRYIGFLIEIGERLSLTLALEFQLVAGVFFF